MNKRASGLLIIIVVILLVLVVIFAFGGKLTGLPTKTSTTNASSCPKISQSSLRLDTPSCLTTQTNAISEARTSWKIEKTASNSTIENPNETEIIYNVKVTEGPTNHLLVAAGQIIISNSGEQTPTLSNVVINLQKKSAGEKYSTISSAIALKDLACKDSQGLEGAQTCFGQFQSSQGSSLILTDKDGNDVTAYLGNVPIPPSTNCSGITILNFKAEFNLDMAGLSPGNNARTEILTTFAGAGPRGNSPDSVSCSADANCNGILDEDNSQTCQLNEAETNNVRTVKQRFSFQIPAFVDVCPTITKADAGASVLDLSCINANSNSLNKKISKQFEGSIDTEQITGTASCINSNNCSADIINTAQIVCNDNRNELIEGSPASASILAICIAKEENKISKGDFCTYTQGGWGATCRGNNPGCIRDNNFQSVFPSGLTIGHINSNYNSKWTSSAAIENFLPAGGTPNVLTANLINPLTTSAGVFAGQITALIFSVKFDDSGVLNSSSSTLLGDLHILSGKFAGLAIRQLLDLANDVVGGNISALTPYSATISDLNNALDQVNNCFDECKTICNFVGF